MNDDPRTVGVEIPSEHAIVCGGCGETFDARDLSQVFAHEHRDLPLPVLAAPGQRLAVPEERLYRSCYGNEDWCGNRDVIPREENRHYHTRSGKVIPLAQSEKAPGDDGGQGDFGHALKALLPPGPVQSGNKAQTSVGTANVEEPIREVAARVDAVMEDLHVHLERRSTEDVLKHHMEHVHAHVLGLSTVAHELLRLNADLREEAANLHEQLAATVDAAEALRKENAALHVQLADAYRAPSTTPRTNVKHIRCRSKTDRYTFVAVADKDRLTATTPHWHRVGQGQGKGARMEPCTGRLFHVDRNDPNGGRDLPEGA